MSGAGMDRIRDERGVSLPELLVSVLMGMILIIAAFGLLQVANRSSARNVARVDANQQARPVMERIMDELRSTCVRRGVVPILPGSTPSTLSFLHETGSDVSPVPDKRTITFASPTLKESVYTASPTTPDAAGVWTFSPTATVTSDMLGNVSKATVNGTANTDVFQYFTYTNGVLTPLVVSPTTGLTTAQAAGTVQVTVSFAAQASKNPTSDTNPAINVTDTALLRFGPPSELSTATNLPCT